MSGERFLRIVDFGDFVEEASDFVVRALRPDGLAQRKERQA